MALTAQAVRTRLGHIASFTRNPPDFRPLSVLVDSIFSARTPTWELGLQTVENAFLRSPAYQQAQQASPPTFRAYMELLGSLLTLLRGRGYRSTKDIVTWQEHYFMGSSSGQRFHEHPPAYRPIGMMKPENPLTLEEVRTARRLAGFLLASRDAFVLDASHEPLLVSAIHVRVSFEDLTPAGETARDPQPVLLQDNRLVVVPGIQKAPAFPFKRE